MPESTAQNGAVTTLLAAQRLYFASGATRSLAFRLAQLKKIELALQRYYPDILQALAADLKKSEAEVVLSELLLLKNELKLMQRSLKKWLQPTSVASAFPACWPGRSYLVKEPYGVVLIISPWNYPLLLTFLPLIGAIAAGNCVIIKPSEVAVNTEALLVKIVKNLFASEYVAVISGEAKVATAILREKLDYIFFTGSAPIAKKVMQAASKHLTPLTCELGGKSPCIIDETANLEFAARRLVWSKFMNAGQTCIAPDYVLVARSKKSALLRHLHTYCKHFYGENAQLSGDYGRIINAKHFARLYALAEQSHVAKSLLAASDKAQLYMPPIISDEIAWDAPLMQEEIFGPILPIFAYDTVEDAINLVKVHAHPLALYLFTHNKATAERITSELAFGGGCINDCMVHLANPQLPFGGVGLSGIGAYHGKYSVCTFSHQKSIFKRSRLWDIFLQYPPYSSTRLRWLKRLLRF